MRESSQTLRTSGQNHAQTRPQRIAAFLREQHPAKTAANVEADTEIPAATVRKWLERGHTPSGEAILKLADRYGPAFLCAAYPENPDAWFVDAARRALQERLERQLTSTQAQLDKIWGRP